MAKKGKTVRYAITTDGKRREITGENGRYYVCGDVQFRKASVTVDVEADKAGETERESGKAKK